MISELYAIFSCFVPAGGIHNNCTLFH
jgi:hypothetical protein